MPQPEPNEDKACKQTRDAYDKANVTILGLTLLAALTAAIFTGTQAWIARDQEQRSLRAYLVVSPILSKKASIGGEVEVDLSVENVGQTPAYNARADIQLDAIQAEQVKADSLIPTTGNCSAIMSGLGGITVGHSIVKKPGGRLAQGVFGADRIDAIADGSRELSAAGTVCYRDVFGDEHALRYCFIWPYQRGEAEECPGKSQTEN